LVEPWIAGKFLDLGEVVSGKSQGLGFLQKSLKKWVETGKFLKGW